MTVAGDPAGPPARLHVARGNKKVHPSIAVWSLPAPDSCPRAGECMAYCYYFKVLKGLLGVVLEAAMGNFDASKRTDFVDRMVATLRSLDVAAVRVHGGDFYSQEYVNKWAEIARRLPGLRFFAYTKSHHAFDVSKLTSLPNFVVVKSYGGLDDQHIDESNDNYAVVIDDESQAKESEFVCPADRPGVKLDGKAANTWCGNKCNYCLPPNGKEGRQIRVAFVKKTNGWNGPTELAARRLAVLRASGTIAEPNKQTAGNIAGGQA